MSVPRFLKKCRNKNLKKHEQKINLYSFLRRVVENEEENVMKTRKVFKILVVQDAIASHYNEPPNSQGVGTQDLRNSR